MTHAEAIQKLDATIAELRTNLVHVSNDREAEWEGKRIKAKVIQLLKEVGAHRRIQQSVQDIFFGKADSLGMSMSINSTLYGGFAGAVKHTSETYMQGVQNTIDILQGERERQKRLMDDEAQQRALAEQQKSNTIQYRAFVCSIVATVIALAAFIVAICK